MVLSTGGDPTLLREVRFRVSSPFPTPAYQTLLVAIRCRNGSTRGPGGKRNPNVTMNLAEYYRTHRKRSLLFVVVAAVLIGLVIDAIAEGIESHNDHVLDAQITESHPK